MGDQQIRWGIIGCGNVTEVKSGPAFNKVPDSRLVAVMRRNGEKAKDYAQRHGVPKWYTSAEELIADEEVNAVYIATPPLHHEEYTIKALQAGKPVYVEKPMALDTASAERMAKAARQTGVPLTVAHYRRGQPLFNKVKSLLDEQAIGDVRLVNLQLYQPDKSSMVAQTEDNWRVRPAISGGGLFYDLAPHQLDIMYYFFGKPSVCKGISLNQGGYYKADDITSAQILFPKNILFNGLWCFTVPQSERRDHCEIIGSKGKISFPVFEHQKIVLVRDGVEEQIPFDKLEHVQQPMIKRVVDYFLGRGANPSPAEEGVEVMRMIDACAGKLSYS